MPHILLIFAANKLVRQVALFLTSIHKINNIYAHQKYMALHGIEHRVPQRLPMGLQTQLPWHQHAFFFVIPFMIYDQLQRMKSLSPAVYGCVFINALCLFCLH